MKLSLAFLQKLKPMRMAQRITAADIIFGGVGVLACILAGLIAIDGYIFYIVSRHEYENALSSSSEITISGAEVDNIIRLLDERAAEYQALLGTK